MIKELIDWAKERASEPTSTIGIFLIGIGTVMLFPAILKVAGAVIVIYGIIIVVKKET